MVSYKYSLQFFQIVTIWENIPLATLANIHVIPIHSKEENQLKIETNIWRKYLAVFLQLDFCAMIIE